MNVPPPYIAPPESSLQGAYVKQTQVASDIATAERTQPQRVNAPVEISNSHDQVAKEAQENADSLTKPELPTKLEVNAILTIVQTRSLSKELSKFPDIDHAKVAELTAQINSSKFNTDSEAIAGFMLDFYQGGR